MDNQNRTEQGGEKKGVEPFVPPRHWIGPEELEESYWKDQKIQEKRGQEFFEKPIELIEKIDKIDKAGFARREFLGIMGASMALASLSCTRRPVHKIIPYVVKPEEITPGIPNWYASTCKECGSDCGILVKTREGRPIKLEGNPDHPLSRGALCTRGQASVLNLYDPDRLKAPLVRSARGQKAQEVSWQDADLAIQAKLKALAGGAGTGRVRILSGSVKSFSTQSLINDFLSGFKQGKHVQFEPLELDEIAESQRLSYSRAVIPDYRFDAVRYVVSLGGDFLGEWLSCVEHSRDWAKGRSLEAFQKASQAQMSKLVCFEPHLSLTGSNADERFPIAPGGELKIALALANEIILNRKLSRFAGREAVLSVLREYSPDRVAADVELEGGAAKIRSVAEELWANRGQSMVIGGSLYSKSKDGLALQVAINLLNSALENEGVTVDGSYRYSEPHSNFADVQKLIAEMNAGQVDALILYRTNPAFTLPELGFAAAVSKVPLVIAIPDREDETALYADYVLPDHHYLENWGDSSARKGLLSIQQPTIAPIHSTRAFEDTLLTWLKGTGARASSLVAQSDSWYHYIQNFWNENYYKKSALVSGFQSFWESVLRVGVFQTAQAGTLSVRPFQDSALKTIPKFSARDTGAISLVLYVNAAMHDGRSANNAWLQEMPDPISSITWDNYLNVSKELADQKYLKENDVVVVKMNGASVMIPVHIQPGMHPKAVSAAVGYGRRASGRVGNEAGSNVFPLVAVQEGRLVYAGQPAEITKTGRIFKLASTQWHTASESRPVINDITLAEYRKDPGKSAHTDPHLRMDEVPSIWPKHEYKGYRWGMAIDLNTCTGCGACVVACQAENNVPVVGRDQVRVSRQMHWLRIDRYYAGSPSNPDVVFQPMLCQHCENAPCETVCPVLATVHDDEGLNVQVYNRCVGTRYCQNNCPYKVRRFNFFDHWKSYQETMNLVWNPDVSVRTRGIMEKCTFCVQRIRDGKDKAKDLDQRVKDGDIVTACQQTCATDAIVFGDINDPNSRVSKLRDTQRAFRALEVLNAKPVISYLTKVRNKPEGHHGSTHG